VFLIIVVKSCCYCC